VPPPPIHNTAAPWHRRRQEGAGKGAGGMANNIFISFDLHIAGPQKAKLEEAIRNLGTHSKLLSGTWYVKTPLRHTQVRDRLKAILAEHDKLLVIDAKDTAGHNLNLSAWSGVVEKWKSLFS
jgi:hypothetical protein